jgi:DNA polymerase theta
LQKQHFLIVEGGKILPTPLGKAAFSSSIPPEESRQIFADLVDARQTQSLILETDLHLLYLITPHFKGLKEPNWNAFLKQFKRLNKAELLVAEIYQITTEYLMWAREIRP